MAAAEGHLAYQGWCAISLPAELEWATLSGMDKTNRGLREAEKKKERWKDWEERGRVSDHKHTKYVGFTTEEAGFSGHMVC